MSRRWPVVAAVIALVAALGAISYRRISAQRGTVQEPVETAVVQRGSIFVTIDATGSMAPHSEASLSFASSGRVAEVFVKEGQEVEAWQPLARLEADQLALQVAQAEATLAAAEAELAQLLASPRPEQEAAQEANLAAMEAQVSAATADRDQLVAGRDEGEIASAEAQLASAIAEQKSAFDMHERTMKCFTFEIPAGTTLPDGTVVHAAAEKKICPALGVPEEQARYSLAVADASLASAQDQLDEVQAGTDTDQVRAAEANVDIATAQRDAAQAELDLLLARATKEQIAVTQASVDDARIALEQAQLHLEMAVLAAPMSGTVTFLGVLPGEIASANQVVVTLGDLETLEVEINLDETDVARVAVGQEARVSMDAFPSVGLSGEVTYIAPVAHIQSGVILYPVTVGLTRSGPAIGQGQGLPVRAGMTADVEIITTSQEDALIVPLRAIKSEGGRSYADRLAGDQTQRVEVMLGLMTETKVQIIDGLSEGDVVVVVVSES